ncbi:O-acetylhomoserine aminocarboxypropyltransferase [Actinomycetota bacterium]|nr:O-acetylhomoserine aminocarboxypropyltransferase [Actinomycetota bacterium]
MPIYQSTSFDLESAARADRLVHNEELGSLYTRIGNPTVGVFEQRIADLDGGVAGLAVASGMAAVSYSLLNLTNIGDHIVAVPYLYGGTVDAFKKILPRLGITVDYAKDLTPQAIDAAITDQTRAVFIESISNPLGLVADIEAIAAVAHKHGLPLVVDNTLATPYLIRPIDFGADIVVYSATKAISGHGNIIAGVIVESGKFDYGNGKFPQFSEERHWTLRDRNDKFRTYLEVFPQFPFTARVRSTHLNYIGAALGPFDAYLALVGLETISERIEKQLSSTRLIIEYLQQNQHVEWVSHSSLTSSANYEVAKRIAPRGAGSVFAFGFKGGQEQIDKFLDSTKLFTYLANLGDARSLIVNPPKVTHNELTAEELGLANIPDNLIRLSIGLEDPRDLIEDLDNAFKLAFKAQPDQSEAVDNTNSVQQKYRQDKSEQDQDEAAA